MTHAHSLRAAAVGVLLLAAASGCANNQHPGAGPSGAGPSGAAPTTDAPINTSQLVPPGFGTLRQDDIAVRMELPGVQVKLIPLDETVIRLLSPDSYRALRDLQESQRTAIANAARRNGLQQYRIWYVSYYGLAPEVRFSPNEVTLTNNGRDFRPLDVLPVTAGFGENRLQQRQTQSALYLFDGALDASQPVVVRVESAVDANTWSAALQRIERERALVRSRASSAAAQRP